MVANLIAAQIKDDFTSSDVTLINCDYQLLWHWIVLNGEMQSNHPDTLQRPIPIIREKKDLKLESKQVHMLFFILTCIIKGKFLAYLRRLYI